MKFLVRRSAKSRFLSWTSSTLVCVASATTGGCGQDSSRSEARAIVSTYEAFQRASAADRPEALRELQRASCTHPSRCGDRDACIAYARALVRATDLAARAHALGPADTGGNSAATSSELAVIVQGAEEALRRAEAAEEKCQHALTRLYDATRQ